MNFSMYCSCCNVALVVPTLLSWVTCEKNSFKTMGRTWGFCWKGWHHISAFLILFASSPSSQVLYSSLEVTFQITLEYSLLVQVFLHLQHRHSLPALQDFRSASLQDLQWGKRLYQNFTWASGGISGRCSASAAVKSWGVQMKLGVWR